MSPFGAAATARNLKCVDGSQDRGNTRIRGPQRNSEFPRVHQDCLQHQQQQNHTAAQPRRNSTPHGEVADAEALARPLQNRPQLPIHKFITPSPTGSYKRNELAQRLAKLPVAAAGIEENASVENRWCQLWDTVQSTALVVLCQAHNQHQGWFGDKDAAISNLLAEKNRLHKKYVNRPADDNKAAFHRSRRLVQQRPREMRDVWAARKAEEIPGYADRNEWKRVLDLPTAISDAAIARLPQVDTNVDLDLPPSLRETIRGVKQLSSGKASGSDAIPAETFPETSRHRDTAGDIFARVLLNRLNNHLEQGLLPESQCGFRRHTGTTDTSFAARQLQEKCQEIRTHLLSSFVDLKKAFDTVNREGLWKILQKFGYPERFIQMVRQLHDGMMARVTDNGAVLETLVVANGVKQGCILAPTIFSLMFSAMLMDTYRDNRPGIRIASRTDGLLSNHRRTHFQSRVCTTTVQKLLFDDECALILTTEGDVQRSMDLFFTAREDFGLIINTEKKVVMHQPPPNTAHNASQITVNGTQLQVVDNFTYLGSNLFHSAKIKDEVARQIFKASQAFGSLQNTVRNGHSVQISTKLKVCKAAILSTLLYGAETRMVYMKQARRLNHFHLSWLQRILKLRWQDRIPNTDLLQQTGILSIHAMLR
ncbi:hypothetical protein SprV_0100175800 [Sparganum proliferum]